MMNTPRSKITFVIISVSDRVDALNALVRSILRFYPEFDINLMYQDYTGNAHLIENQWAYRNIFIEPLRLGCHGARLALLKKIKYETYINLDDDMELLDVTKYARAIEKSRYSDTGFVLTNWAKTLSLVQKKIPKMTDSFVKQILVYNGGGMVYSDAVAQVMREQLPMVKATFDTVWPLTAYINGFTNYRYLGSLAVHRVCGTGGMRDFLNNTYTVQPSPDLINYRRVKNPTHDKIGNGRDFHIPLDPDVSAKARGLHILNKR